MALTVVDGAQNIGHILRHTNQIDKIKNDSPDSGFFGGSNRGRGCDAQAGEQWFHCANAKTFRMFHREQD